MSRYTESKCGSCVHSDACAAWIRHGSTLYSDFSYSVEGCPYYLPKSDVVEVVRCKDCKFYWGKYLSGTKICGLYREIHLENWFCASGERKEDGTKAD